MNNNTSPINWNEFIFRTIVGIHFFFLIGTILSMLVLPFAVQWYLWIPIESWILNMMTSKVLDCPMTRLENKYRILTGRPVIKAFVKHYIIKPALRARRKLC